MTIKKLITEGTRVTREGTRVTEGTKPSGEKYVRVSQGTLRKPSLIQQFIKPKDISQKALEKKKILLRKWQKQDLPKWVTDFMGDPLKFSDRERKIVLPFYGKSSEDALQQKGAMTSYLNYVAKEVKSNPEKVVLFAALPPALKIAGSGIRAAGITRLITKVPHGQLIARGTINTISAALGVAYSADVYSRVTAPVFTGYKDGKSTETKKTLPNGDIEITTTTEQTPQFRKPTGPEQHERIGGIFATELAPLAISHRIINRGVKKGYKPEPKPKTKVKITTVIKRAGKVIKTIPSKVKKARDIKAAKDKALKEKVRVLEVTKSGKLKILEKTRAQLLKDLVKAKAKERKAIQQRLKKVERDIKIAETKALKQKVTVLEVTKTGKLKKTVKTRAQVIKDVAKGKTKERKEIIKRLAQAEIDLKKPKIVKLRDSAYTNITRLSKLKAKLMALITKINNISASVAKKLGINKIQEINRIKVLVTETEVVKTYIVMIQRGASKKVIVKHLQKIPENKLRVLDTKTGKIIKDIEKTTQNIELRIIKPSKKPEVEYKEVKVGNGQVQLQKVVTKQEIKTVVLAKTELKALQKLEAKARSISKSKISTKLKQKQLVKVNTKLKTKRTLLLLYKQRLNNSNIKLKQKQRQLTILMSKQSAAEKAKTRQIIIFFSTQITKIDAAIISITKVISEVIPIQVIKEVTVPKSRIVTKPIPKKKTVVVPVLKPPLLIPKKTPTKKKKRKMTAAEIRAYTVINPIPSLARFLG